MIPKLEKQHTGNQDIELLLENIKKFAKPLEDNPLLDGVLIEGIEFAGIGAVNIDHKLGRVPRGWILVDKAGAGNIFRGTAWTDKVITIGNSLAVACTVKIWVF